MRADDLVGYASRQVERVAARLREVFGGKEAEAVHQLRVASRRLNEPLRLMGGWAKRGKVRKARRGLRRLRGLFRQVRDLDVLLMNLGEAGTQQIVEADELAELEGRLTGRRARAWARACRGARQGWVGRTLKLVRGLVEETAGGGRESAEVACGPLARLLDKRAAALVEMDPRLSESIDLHQVRLRLKRFRYGLELKERLTGEDGGSLIGKARAMQDLLGRWNDRLMAAREVSRAARRRGRLRRQTASSARLLRYAAWWAGAAEGDRKAVLEQWPGLLGEIGAIGVSVPSK